VHRKQLDHLPGKPSFRFDRLVPGGFELAKQTADFLVISLQDHDRIR
jgi:hypothetical protein